MKTKKVIALSTTFLLSSLIMPFSFAHEGGYVTDSSGKGVLDGNKDCVKAALGNTVEGCGAPPPPPEPTPVEVAPPPPVIAPPPPVMAKPKPKPAPPPKVHVLNLNESGGSNFATDSAKLSASARNRLTAFANTVKASRVSPSNITIVGHTDSRGSNAYNQKLSTRRAQSVAAFLASQGLNRGVMSVSGRGETQPVASNKTKAGRAANRRVAISVKGQRRVTGR